jgi:hypothetical protein
VCAGHVHPGDAGECLLPSLRQVLPQLHYLAADRLRQAAEFLGLDGPDHATAQVVRVVRRWLVSMKALELGCQLRRRRREGENDVGGGYRRAGVAVGQGGQHGLPAGADFAATRPPSDEFGEFAEGEVAEGSVVAAAAATGWELRSRREPGNKPFRLKGLREERPPPTLAAPVAVGRDEHAHGALTQVAEGGSVFEVEDLLLNVGRERGQEHEPARPGRREAEPICHGALVAKSMRTDRSFDEVAGRQGQRDAGWPRLKAGDGVGGRSRREI